MTQSQKHALLNFSLLTSTEQSDSQGNILTPTSLRQQHLAFSILEILEHILAFLTLSDRQNSARLVCKQWHAICEDLVHVSCTWKVRFRLDTNNSRNGTQETLNPASHVQKLVIKINGHVTLWTEIAPKHLIASWTEMMDALSTITLEHEHRRLKSLLWSHHLRKGVLVNFATQLTQQPLFTTLTTFSIDAVVDWDIIHLFTILRACPNLVELSVAANEASQLVHRVSHVEPALTSSEEHSLISSSNALSTQNRLRTCCLYNVILCLPALRVFLKACPRLSKLVLERWTHFVRQGQDTTTLLDPAHYHARRYTNIIQLVGEHCPSLKSFHMTYSSHGYGLSDREVVASSETFPLKEEYNSTSWELDPVLLKTPSTTATVNWITTLDLLPSSSPDVTTRSFRVLDVSLRKILCTFEHLLHLRAPLETYYIEDMELDRTTEQMREDWNNKRVTSPVTSIDHAAMNQYRYTWVCRGLRTLHMTVDHKHTNPEPDYSEMSLAIFGYLSRMCPQLQELHLARWSICLKFNGGLCLLARLRHLKRLRLVSSTTCYVNEKYLFWMDPAKPTQQQQYPVSMQDRLLYPVECRQKDQDFHRWYRFVPAAISTAMLEIVPEQDDEHAWWEGLGYIDDLLDWMEDWSDAITTASPNNRLLLPLWLSLESFWIECDLWTGPVGLQSTKEFLTRVRPNVDVRLGSIQGIYKKNTLNAY